MKIKRVFFVVFSCLILSCTSNTIYKKPKDLVAKDTMVLLLKDLYLAAAAKNVNNKQAQRRFSYVPLVYEKYKIDSARFQRSNLYYTSKIDIYAPMLEEVLNSLEGERKVFAQQKKVRDSLRQDSLKKNKSKLVLKNQEIIELNEARKKKKNLKRNQLKN